MTTVYNVHCKRVGSHLGWSSKICLVINSERDLVDIADFWNALTDE